jgi:hypothetical protein
MWVGTDIQDQKCLANELEKKQVQQRTKELCEK